MKDGKLVASGGITVPGKGEKIAEAKFEDTVKDALGNDVKVKGPKRTLTNKEKKKRAKVWNGPKPLAMLPNCSRPTC